MWPLNDRCEMQELERRIEREAAKLRRPSVPEFEDLVQCGWIGAMLAARRFDASRGYPFWAYARHRVRGEMLDCLAREPKGLTQTSPDSLTELAAPDPEPGAGAMVRSLDVRRSLDGLEPCDARLVVDLFIRGVSVEHGSGSPRETRRRARKSLRKLRVALTGYERDL